LNLSDGIRSRSIQHLLPLLITSIKLQGHSVLLNSRCVFFQVIVGEAQQRMSFSVSLLREAIFQQIQRVSIFPLFE